MNGFMSGRPPFLSMLGFGACLDKMDFMTILTPESKDTSNINMMAPQQESGFGCNSCIKFEEIQRLQREMNHLFSGFGQTTSYDFPPMNVWLSENEVIVTAELPGIGAGDVDISVIGDSLTLSGVREDSRLKEGESYHRQERGFGRFARTIKLPFHVETDKVDARYERGILQVILPRTEAERPKKIVIKAE